MGFLARVSDGLQNLVANLGTERDKAAASGYGLVTLTDDLILAAYRGAWLPRKIVDIPAQDACRKWRDWQASPDQIEAIEAEEKRLGLRAKILDARIKARLFGGAVVFIGTGDQNPAEELRPERVGKAGLLYLTVLSRREITAGEIETDPLSPFYGKPKDYQISSAGGRGQVTVHPSRLVTFIGQSVGDDQLAGGLTKGWGDSVLQSTYDAVRNADATAANIASLVFEAKVDVFRIPELMGSIADPAYEARLLKRFGVASTAKAINGALILDKEEEYEQKSATFQSLPDVLDRFLQLVSGAADIPTTRLLGQSPAGMNSTGEGDLRNYYDRLSSEQELVMGPAMAVLDECLIRSALGSRPPEVHYIWASLWQVSDKERAEIGVASANTIKTLVDTGLFPQEALAVAGANMLVERSIMPGLEQAIDDAGGLPDYEAVLEAEREQEAARLQAEQQGGKPTAEA
jgi:phage-related protein (TIGR01555 family)